jgi:hypothetical protein
VGIEASGNRSCQERDSGKGSYRDTSVHEIRKLQHVLCACPCVNWALNTRDVGSFEIRIPQSCASHKPVIQHPVLSFIAIREASNATEGAKDEEGDTSHHFLSHAAVSVVGCQGC